MCVRPASQGIEVVLRHTTKTYLSKHLERFPMKLHQEFLPANRQSDTKQPTLSEQKYSSDEALFKSCQEIFYRALLFYWLLRFSFK